MQVDEEDTMETIHEDDENQDMPGTDAFIPGRHVLEKDEILQPDDSVYEMRHSMQVKWPSLSFDVLRDNLGDQRQRYPATAYIVAGTQAPSAKDNELSVYKMSALHRTQNDGGKPLPVIIRSNQVAAPVNVPVQHSFSFFSQMTLIPMVKTMRMP
jgi:ribosome assembly protein RRB1